MAKKAPAKKPAKATAKAPAKKAAKPVKAPKAPAKPLAKAPAKPVHKSPPAGSKPVPDSKKSPARKGITVVPPKAVAAPAKKPAKVKAQMAPVVPVEAGRLLDPKGPARKPLIPSGPRAAHVRPLGMQGEVADAPRPKVKSPYGKKDLAHFRQILLRKRAELVGDVSQMETEALKGGSGSLSNLPQHMAEQGSDTYDQSLALEIAATDRKLIKEIDDAIKRIDNGTYGVCELTGKPINPERLEELPWARYSIEAARELERRNMRAS